MIYQIDNKTNIVNTNHHSKETNDKPEKGPVPLHANV